MEQSGFSCCLWRKLARDPYRFLYPKPGGGEECRWPSGPFPGESGGGLSYYLAVNEPDLIHRIITQEFHYWNPGESREIERYAYHLLDDSEAEEASTGEGNIRILAKLPGISTIIGIWPSMDIFNFA